MYFLTGVLEVTVVSSAMRMKDEIVLDDRSLRASLPLFTTGSLTDESFPKSAVLSVT
jgi:hypothetical protein